MPEEQLYLVRRPIRYKKPGPQYRTIVKPGEYPEGLDFPHLAEVEIALLLRKGVIVKKKRKAKVKNNAENS